MVTNQQSIIGDVQEIEIPIKSNTIQDPDDFFIIFRRKLEEKVKKFQYSVPKRSTNFVFRHGKSEIFHPTRVRELTLNVIKKVEK